MEAMDEEEGDDDGGHRDVSIVTLADCEGLAVAPQRSQSIAWSDDHLVAAAVGHEVVLLVRPDARARTFQRDGEALTSNSRMQRARAGRKDREHTSCTNPQVPFTSADN